MEKENQMADLIRLRRQQRQMAMSALQDGDLRHATDLMHRSLKLDLDIAVKRLDQFNAAIGATAEKPQFAIAQ